MKDRHGKAFYALFQALKQLVTIDRYLPELQPRLTWTQTASSYQYDLMCAANNLKDHVYEYPHKAQAFIEHLKTIVDVGEALNKNIAITNDQLHFE